MQKQKSVSRQTAVLENSENISSETPVSSEEPPAPSSLHTSVGAISATSTNSTPSELSDSFSAPSFVSAPAAIALAVTPEIQGEPAAAHLHIDIQSQPDDVTCGPTCLHAVYQYFGDNIPLARVVEEITRLRDVGTLASFLACHALRRGYRARLYTYDMKTFDPTWLVGDHRQLPRKLRQQMEVKTDEKLRFVSQGYLDYLALGGKIYFEDLTRNLIRRPLMRRLPIIVGLSSTYLYREIRDIPETNESDDIRGLPGGHFVVLHGYDRVKRTVSVADPYGDNPLTGLNGYEIPIDRVICAILLGIVTYDANMLVLIPPDRKDIR